MGYGVRILGLGVGDVRCLIIDVRSRILLNPTSRIAHQKLFTSPPPKIVTPLIIIVLLGSTIEVIRLST